MGSVECHYTVPSSAPVERSEGTSCLGPKTSLHQYRMQDKYDVLGLMAQGGFGKVFLSRHRSTGMQVALKELTKARVRVAYIKMEVGILKDLRHPNITQLLEVIESKDKVHLVLEYVMGVNLRQELRRSDKNRLQEKDAQRIFRDILEAVDYCHGCGIVHGDLKPENVLIDTQGRAKVCDFGLGIRFLPGQEVTTVGGTLAYSAPETISCQQYEGPPLDIWALGVTLYEMITGDSLFYGGKSQIIQNILYGTVCYPKFVSNNAKNLTGKILNRDPRKRPTIQKVLKHRWIRGVRPPSPPEPLPVNTKRAILSRMAAMGFDPLMVMDTLRKKNYNHEMATFLLLQTQALQGPVHEAADKTSWRLTGPAPSAYIPWRRAGEPVPCTGRLFPGVKTRGQEGGRGSQPPRTIKRTPNPSLSPGSGHAAPSLSPWSGPASPSLSPRPGPASPSLSPRPGPASPSLSPRPGPASPSLSPRPGPASSSLSLRPGPAAPSLSPRPGPAAPSLSPRPGPASPSLSPRPGPASPSLSPRSGPASPSLSPRSGPASPSLSPRPGTASPNLSAQPGLGAPRSSATANRRRRYWKAFRRSLTGSLRALCCCCLPPSGHHRH